MLKAFFILFSSGFFLHCCFSPFKNFKVSNSVVEDKFNQVDLVLIDPSFRDYDGEQNSVRFLTLELGNILDKTEYILFCEPKG